MAALTKRSLDAAKSAAKEYFLWCSTTPGFGIRIYPSGKKIFVERVRVGRATRRVKIGAYGPENNKWPEALEVGSAPPMWSVLVINLKTAKALGLTVPTSLLGRADEVIEWDLADVRFWAQSGHCSGERYS